MRSFGKGHKFGERPSFGKRRFDGGGHDRPVMHKATCSKCGKECEVPFRPSGNKPVLCLDCFRAEGGGQNGFERKSFGKSNPPERLPDPRPAMKAYHEELTKVNEKLDKILALLLPTEK
jgi:CxxC-x17-CxxC domain-containing protein